MTNGSGSNAGQGRPWAVWLAWTWALLVILAVASVLLGWDDLRLALDFQRHLR